MKAPTGYTGLRISLTTLLALILGLASMQASAVMMTYQDVDSTGWNLGAGDLEPLVVEPLLLDDDDSVGGILDVVWDLGTPGFIAGPEYGLGSGTWDDNIGFTPGTAHSASFKMWLNGGCQASDTDDSCGAIAIFELYGLDDSFQGGALGTTSFAFGDFSISGSLFTHVNDEGFLIWQAFDVFGDGDAYIEAVALVVTAYEKEVPVPAPSALGLFAIGLLGLGLFGRRKA